MFWNESFGLGTNDWQYHCYFYKYFQLYLPVLDKVFIQAFGLACEVYVEVSPLCSLPTTVCEVADSVVCQVAMLPFFNSL